VVVESVKHFVIAMGDHDCAQNKSHQKQGKGLQSVQKVHVVRLREKPPEYERIR
jgi:hypothetical protein